MALPPIWAQILRGATEVLLPALCPICRVRDPAVSKPLCDECLRGLLALREPFCPQCGLPYHGAGPSHSCPRCESDPPPFETLRAWGTYDGALLGAVRAFKFSRRFALRRVLEDLVVEAFDRFYSEATNGVRAVVPVPCRRSTLRRRGFDLPALLARRLARSRALSWRPEALMKLADTPDLVRLGAAARVRAVKRAYAPRESLEGPVLLVDDVVTSTATARACARSCLDAGADRVLVLALARTPREIR